MVCLTVLKVWINRNVDVYTGTQVGGLRLYLCSRTNNSVEAWHRAFQQTVDCHHPSIHNLIAHFWSKTMSRSWRNIKQRGSVTLQRLSQSKWDWTSASEIWFQRTATYHCSTISEESHTTSPFEKGAVCKHFNRNRRTICLHGCNQ